MTNSPIDCETFTATLDPRRELVGRLLAEISDFYDNENPAQILMDVVMSLSIVGCVLEADVDDIISSIRTAQPNAKKAADFMMSGNDV